MFSTLSGLPLAVSLREHVGGLNGSERERARGIERRRRRSKSSPHLSAFSCSS